MTFEKLRQFRCNVRTFLRITFLLFSLIMMCGFSWGDPCSEATEAITGSKEGITEQLAERVIALCPDSAVGHLAKGYRLERRGDTGLAIGEYRKAIEADTALGQAHGNLGLLLLDQGLDNEAAVELTKALMGKPDPRYHRGLALLLSRGAGASLLIFHSREALKADPEDPAVHLWLADAFAERGEQDQAVEEYAYVLAREAGNEHARLGLALSHKKSGKLDDAIREFSTAVLDNPSNDEIHLQLAGLYLQKGDKALADKEMLLAGLNPTDADIGILTQQGDQHLLARNYDKALEAYEKILKKRPNWPEALEKLGDAHMAAGHDDEAISAYRQTLVLDQANPSLHYPIGILHERKGLLDEAEGYYRKSLEYDPKNGDARRRLADMYTLRGRFRQSIEEYTELIRLRGDNPILHFKLARVYDKNKEFNKAITAYLTTLRLAPDNLEAKKELASLYLKRGMVDEAEGQYRELLNLDRSDKEIRNVLVASYVKRKNYDGLLQLFKEIVEQTPDDPNSHYRLGIIHDHKKEYDSAAAEYQKAIELNSSHAKALNALGRLYLKTGRVEKAKSLLEAARVADPDFIEPLELLGSLRDEQVLKAKQHRGNRKVKKIKKGISSKKKVNKKKLRN